jgi:chemotaxis protein MotA
MSLEQDLDAPDASELFKNYPKILNDHHVLAFLTDNLRIIVAGNLASHEFEALLEKELEVHHDELDKPAEAVNRVADGMPGFGIVAAVLGIVITMSLIGGDPKILGVHIAAALVGTFTGILLSYGILGPISVALGNLAKSEGKYYECMKIFLVAVASGVPPSLTVEYARRVLYSDIKPGFTELEEYIKKK